MKTVYLDNNATTRVGSPRALRSYAPFSDGNATETHRACTRSRRGARDVAWARESLAALLDVSQQEVIFTSGGMIRIPRRS